MKDCPEPSIEHDPEHYFLNCTQLNTDNFQYEILLNNKIK